MTSRSFLAAVVLLIGFSALSADDVELHRLDGSVAKGELAAIGPQGVQVAGAESVPLDQVLWISFANPTLSSEPPKARIALRGGGILLAQDVITDERLATVKLKVDRVFSVPLERIAGILLGSPEPAAVERWLASAKAGRQTDLLVAVRGTERAELEGVIGPLSGERLSFELDGEEIAVKRERVFAIYLGTTAAPPTSLAEVQDTAGNVWPADSVEWKENQLVAKSPAYGEVSFTAGEIVRVDFSKQRVTFLSDIEPNIVEHVPFFDVAHSIGKDVGLTGEPIRIADTAFAKGLVMHSKTTATYDIGGQYRRFACIIGIESAVGKHGDAQVQITGDGKILWEGRVRGGEAGVAVDLPLAGVQKLAVAVDYGALADIGDHVALGDARLIK